MALKPNESNTDHIKPDSKPEIDAEIKRLRISVLKYTRAYYFVFAIAALAKIAAEFPFFVGK